MARIESRKLLSPETALQCGFLRSSLESAAGDATEDELPDEIDEESNDLPRMTLLDHLDELRKRLFASVIAIFVAFIGCWYFSPTIFHWLQEPILVVLSEGDMIRTGQSSRLVLSFSGGQ